MTRPARAHLARRGGRSRVVERAASPWCYPGAVSTTAIRRALCPWIGLLSFAGCGAPAAEHDCRTANWYTRGRDDGERGRPVEALVSYEQACAAHQTRPDRQAWAWGHYVGLYAYCSEDGGYGAGRRGAAYEGGCFQRPGGDIGFLTGYRRGLQANLDDLAAQMNALYDRSGSPAVPRATPEDLPPSDIVLRYRIEHVRRLLTWTDQRLADAAPAIALPPPPSPSVEALLARLVVDDPQFEPAARAIAASGDVPTRRAASTQLLAVARILTSTAWRAARRAQLQQAGAGDTPALIEVQIEKDRDARLATALAAMRAIGGAEVVAYCFDLAANEAAPLLLRRSALDVLVQHVDKRDAAAQARGAALWARVTALSAAGASSLTPPRPRP
jgi:Protein of unknown function (DUF2799)